MRISSVETYEASLVFQRFCIARDVASLPATVLGMLRITFIAHYICDLKQQPTQVGGRIVIISDLHGRQHLSLYHMPDGQWPTSAMTGRTAVRDEAALY